MIERREGRKTRPKWRRFAVMAFAVVLLWAGTAYLFLPFMLTHFDRQAKLGDFPFVTRTSEGMAGDPLNVGIVGTREELISLMAAANWRPADPITLRTSMEIVDSVVLDRSYADAPVSPLYVQGRKQDFAFEKAVGKSADRRQHARFWQVLTSGAEGRPVWLGSASFDAGVGFSHYTGQVTHAIDPNVDKMRDILSADLAATGRIAETYEITGVGMTVFARNGEGDRYFTDGEVRFSVIASAGDAGQIPPRKIPSPALVEIKNRIWKQMTAAIVPNP